MPMQLRLAILSVLESAGDELICLMGIKCSSWVGVNVGTSQRSVLNPMGWVEAPSVASANKMVSRPVVIFNVFDCLIRNLKVETRVDLLVGCSRCAIFIMLLVVANALPMVEQPNSSCMMGHDRMKWLLKILRKQGITVPGLSFGCTPN